MIVIWTPTCVGVTEFWVAFADQAKFCERFKIENEEDGFQSNGEFDFRNARIGGNVECHNAVFSCKDQALTFNRATIDGMVLLGKGLLSAGQISFASTKIGRDFSVQGVSLEGNPCLNLRNAEIKGTLTWRGIKYARGLLDLTGVTCRNLRFDEPSEHSEFQPLWYSADVLLPLVNLRQEVDWAPRVAHPDGSPWLFGNLVRWWEWFEIMAGWLLSLLMVSAIGGIIRR